MDEQPLDCLVIGGGPAGLTAAIYLARFHMDILVVDGGKSRAALIPCTHNHAGFPDGISGKELLKRMQDQACKYGAKVVCEFVSKLERDEKTEPLQRHLGFGLGDSAKRAACDRRQQSPPANGRSAARRRLGPRPH
jgi:thioredoxin reductase